MTHRVSLVSAVAAGLISGVGASLLIAMIPANRQGPAAPASSSPPPQVVHVDHLAVHRRAIQQHDAEQLDPHWSESTARSLTSTIAKLGKTSGFRVSNVDCRTTSCVAHLSWNNHQTAVTHYAEVLHQDLPVNCGRETVLPRPLDPAGRYPTEVVFRCQRPELEAAPGAGPSVREQSRKIERQIASE
jgi:hypothetical protein